MTTDEKKRLAQAPQRLGVSPATIDLIRKCDYDRILEKHEGPESWDWAVRLYDLEMFQVDAYRVLFPLRREHHAKITILRCIPSKDEQVLTIFLKDTTYNHDPEMETFDTGFLAVCEKFPGEDFYLTTVYHEWYIVDNHTILNS